MLPSENKWYLKCKNTYLETKVHLHCKVEKFVVLFCKVNSITIFLIKNSFGTDNQTLMLDLNALLFFRSIFAMLEDYSSVIFNKKNVGRNLNKYMDFFS